MLSPIFSTLQISEWVKLAPLCPTLCDLMDYTVHGILQARILEWVAFPFSRGFSQPRDRIQVSCIAGGFFTSWATREAEQSMPTPRLGLLLTWLCCFHFTQPHISVCEIGYLPSNFMEMVKEFIENNMILNSRKRRRCVLYILLSTDTETHMCSNYKQHIVAQIYCYWLHVHCCTDFKVLKVIDHMYNFKRYVSVQHYLR